MTAYPLCFPFTLTKFILQQQVYLISLLDTEWVILTTVNFPLFFLYFLWAGPCGEIVVVPTVLYYLCSHRSSLAHVWGISVQITVQNVLLRVRVSLGLHVKFSDTFNLILVTPLIYKHVNSKFPNKDVISSKPSELRVLRYLYYDNNHSTHKQIFIEDVQFRKHSKMMEKLNLLCFTKYEAQQHDIFV